MQRQGGKKPPACSYLSENCASESRQSLCLGAALCPFDDLVAQFTAAAVKCAKLMVIKQIVRKIINDINVRIQTFPSQPAGAKTKNI